MLERDPRPKTCDYASAGVASTFVAADALVAGLDSPQLRELAGAEQSTDPASMRELVTAVASELGMRSPSTGEAALAYALVGAALAQRGELDAVSHAMAVGADAVYGDTEEEAYLAGIFGYLYYADEDSGIDVSSESAERLGDLLPVNLNEIGLYLVEITTKRN